MPKSPKPHVTSAARKVSAPLRKYMNGHFQETKDEVRSVGREVNDLTERLDSMAETQLQLSNEIHGSLERIDELAATVHQLTAVLAAAVDSGQVGGGGVAR